MNRMLAVLLSFGLLTSAACGQAAKEEPKPDAKTAQPAAAAAAPKVEHVFRGVVQQVDTDKKSLSVAGEDVPGWMGAMTMMYGADKPEIFATVKAGDHITAKVYDGDFSTLHDVQVVVPDSTPADKK